MCGIAGVRLDSEDGNRAAALTVAALKALQHRGQESAGLAVSDGNSMCAVKEMGLVDQALPQQSWQSLVGRLASGQVRYSTTGSSTWSNAQPLYREGSKWEFVLCHNGNVFRTGLEDFADTLMSDSDLVAEMILEELEKTGDLVEAILTVLRQFVGAYSLIIMDNERLIGIRDPQGFHPLCIGRLEDGYILASETCALDTVGAEFVAELGVGEMVVIDESGMSVTRLAEDLTAVESAAAEAKCIFEMVYFSRPSSVVDELSVWARRMKMGKLLAQQSPVEADVVIGVPYSGLIAADGYALESGMPHHRGLDKNNYIGRTFTNPDRSQRSRVARSKYIPIGDVVCGKRIVLVDDSIVRGTTMRALVKRLYQAGAVEVHLRISSPRIVFPCFFGIDMATEAELLARVLLPEDHFLSDEQIAEIFDCDSVAFLKLENLELAVGSDEGWCTGCLTGNYPVNVPVDLARAKQASKWSEQAVPNPH